MAGVLDFLFGSGSLKKAAGSGDNPTPKPQGNQDAGLDIAKMAQDQADKVKASAPPKPSGSPLSTPMTPQKPNGGMKGK